MNQQNTSNGASDKSAQMANKMFGLAMGRVFRNVYLGLDDENKKKMEKVFLSEDAEEKEKFIEEHMSNLKKLFDEEAVKLAQEVESKMQE